MWHYQIHTDKTLIFTILFVQGDCHVMLSRFLVLCFVHSLPTYLSSPRMHVVGRQEAGRQAWNAIYVDA
jgi:hypothetical protein